MWPVGARLLWTLVGLLTCSVAMADEPIAPSQPWLFGTWGGSRTRLFDMGVDLQLGFAGEFGYNAAGGSNSIGSFTGQALFGATLDLEKLITLPKTKMQVTYTSRFGRNLVEDAHLDTVLPWAMRLLPFPATFKT